MDDTLLRNARGQLIHPSMLGIECFWRWFGASKVVDEKGRPLVVYHGTARDFDAFDNSKAGANDMGLWGRGHYFSSTPENANSYALRQGDGARVIAAYVSIKNPLVLRTGDDLVIRLPDGTNTRDLTGQNLDGSKIKSIALDGRHDGVIQIKPDGSIGDVVAFRPEQIKSAIGNDGRFALHEALICGYSPMDVSVPWASLLGDLQALEEGELDEEERILESVRP